jgi:hypothetical protein
LQHDRAPRDISRSPQSARRADARNQSFLNRELSGVGARKSDATL